MNSHPATSPAAQPTSEFDSLAQHSNAGDSINALPPAHPKARGFQVWKLRVRYLKSAMEMGWGHDEGDCMSRTLFAISNIYEADRRAALRIICGRHSVWLFL